MVAGSRIAEESSSFQDLVERGVVEVEPHNNRGVAVEGILDISDHPGLIGGVGADV